jgi:putative FmdB family regulatory protein
MPIHEYAAAGKGCAYCEAHFDVLQKLHEPALASCPRCGAPVVRVLAAPSVVSGGAHRLKESHLEKHGFTQYRRVGRGRYEKTVGKGPQYLGDE